MKVNNIKFAIVLLVISTVVAIGSVSDAYATPTGDFKIQRGNEVISVGSLGFKITEGLDFEQCVGDCFIKIVSSRHSGMGKTSGGGPQNFDDFQLYISDSSGLNLPGGDVTFTRHGTVNNDRFTWEIWEYIGDPNGPNEIKVLDIGVCSFSSGSATCDSTVVAGGASNDNNVVVFVSALANPDTGRANVQRCMVTSEWVDASNISQFTRSETGNSCKVSYAVVEFTGSNWNVQRIEHTFSSSTTQTETIMSVGDISRAFFHTQQRNSGGNSYDGLCQSGSEVELTSPSNLTYKLPRTASAWGGNMVAVTWIISNNDTDIGEKMIVNHYNPTDQINISGPEEENWQPTIISLTHTTTESALTGLSTQSDGCGNWFPRSHLSAILTSSSRVDFYQSDSGQEQEYTFQVVEFPRSEKMADAVTDLNVTAISGTQIDLDWSVPSDDGGSPITGYQIERESPVGGGFSVIVADTGSTATTHSDTGLLAGTEYNYRVSAINGGGVALPSNEDDTITLDVPDATTGLSATTVSDTQVDLDWSVPSDDGGSPITGYQIERESPVGGGFSVIVADTGSTATTHSDTGLLAGTEYNYRVSAINAIQVGAASNEDDAITLDVPDATTGLSATTVSDTQVDLDWSVPSDDGGSPITGYQIERESPVGGGFSVIVADTGSTATTHSDTGLLAGTEYNYRVSAINAIQVGAASNEDDAITLDVPDATTGLSATTVSDTQVDLDWSVPSDDGGSPITGYQIERESPVGGGFSVIVADTGSTATTHSDTGLLAGTEYNYRVSAINAIQVGAASNEDDAITLDVPDATTGLSATTVSDTQVDLDWSVPSDDGGSPITGYQIERESPVGGGFSVIVADTGSTATTHSDTGLLAGTEYNYRVSAINAIQVGAASNEDDAITLDVPDATTGLSATTVSDTQVDLDWSVPSDDGGSPITGYQIERESPVGGGFSVIVADTGSTATTHSDTGLLAGTEYNYRVSAINAIQVGAASNEDDAITLDVPDAPTSLTTTVNFNQIDLSWTVPTDNGSPITGYQIERESPVGGGFSVIVADTGSTATTHSDIGLLAGTEYNYRVSAINAIGVGSPSNDNNSSIAKNGGDNAWDTRPTFGINHETRETTMVDSGFSFNGNSFSITDNHHTPFDQQTIEIGTVNSFTATVYADKDLKVQEFLFGIPEVGMGHLAEMRVEVWYDNTGEIQNIKVIQDTEVIDRTSLKVTHQKSKCLDSDTEENCDTTFMSAVFLEPLADDVMAIKAIDFKLRGQTSYLNDGFDVSGDSLNLMETKMIPSPTKGEGLIEVTQNEKYSSYWITEDGRIFEMNSFGSFKQINQSFERFQDTGDTRTRVHSEYGLIVQYEKNRALDIFDSAKLISKLPDSFSHDILISERMTEEMMQEMVIQEHIAQKTFDELVFKQTRWN